MEIIRNHLKFVEFSITNEKWCENTFQSSLDFLEISKILWDILLHFLRFWNLKICWKGGFFNERWWISRENFYECLMKHSTNYFQKTERFHPRTLFSGRNPVFQESSLNSKTINELKKKIMNTTFCCDFQKLSEHFLLTCQNIEHNIELMTFSDDFWRTSESIFTKGIFKIL